MHHWLFSTLERIEDAWVLQLYLLFIFNVFIHAGHVYFNPDPAFNLDTGSITL